MIKRHLVHCTDALGRTMAGIYAAGLTATVMVATWKRERAYQYDSEADAATVARCLERKFSGTTWEASSG